MYHLALASRSLILVHCKACIINLEYDLDYPVDSPDIDGSIWRSLILFPCYIFSPCFCRSMMQCFHLRTLAARSQDERMWSYYQSSSDKSSTYEGNVEASQNQICQSKFSSLHRRSPISPACRCWRRPSAACGFEFYLRPDLYMNWSIFEFVFATQKYGMMCGLSKYSINNFIFNLFPPRV